MTIPARWGLLAAFLAVAAATAPAEDEKPREPSKPFVKSVEVTVTNLEVVVVDSKGNRVPELTKDAFEIRENGDLQALTNFFEVSNGEVVSNGFNAPPAAALTPDQPAVLAPPLAPKSHVIVFLDNLHLTPSRRNIVLRHLSEFLPKSIGPTAEAMVVTWNRSLTIRQPFTGDRTVLEDAVSRAGDESALGNLPVTERNNIIRQIDEAIAAQPNARPFLIQGAIETARAFSEAGVHDVDATLKALRVMSSQLAGLEGRKMLLYVTEDIPQAPGVEISQYLRQRLLALSPRLAESLTIPNELDFDRTKSFRDFVQVANGAGVTVYTLDARGLSSDASLSAESASSIDLRQARTGSEAMLQMMAVETGGAAVINQNDVGAALASLERDWSSYYSLGYESSHTGSARPRSVNVSVREKGLTVRFRHSIVEKTAETRITDAVYSSLYFPRIFNPLRARLDIGKASRTGKQYVIPVTFTVPYDRLTLIPEGGRARGRMVFYASVRDGKGRLSELVMQQVPIELKSMPPGGEFVYETKLKVRGGRQTLSLALSDDFTKTTSFVQPQVVVGSKEEAGLPARR